MLTLQESCLHHAQMHKPTFQAKHRILSCFILSHYSEASSSVSWLNNDTRSTFCIVKHLTFFFKTFSQFVSGCYFVMSRFVGTCCVIDIINTNSSYLHTCVQLFWIPILALITRNWRTVKYNPCFSFLFWVVIPTGLIRAPLSDRDPL